MHQHYVTESNYGTLGQALYRTGSQSWEFTRDPRCEIFNLRRLGQYRLVLSSCSKPLVHKEASSTISSLPWKRLSLACPDLIPAASIISTAVNGDRMEKSIFDSSVAASGDLISFGRAIDSDNRKTKSIHKLLALATGACGEDLQLYAIHKERCGWTGDRQNWLKVPRISSLEPGSWRGDGAPIQQICFSTSDDEQNTLLAVRFFRSVSIFKPTFRRKPVAQPSPMYAELQLPDSQIDPNWLFSLASDSCSEKTYLHVTFNPWLKRRFATVDSYEILTVYEIGGRASRKGYKAVVVNKSTLSETVKNEDIQSKSCKAEWARISWVKDVNIIIACKRRKVLIYDVEEAEPSKQDVNVGLNANDVILDMQKCKNVDDYVLLLTSRSLLLLKVKRLNEPVGRESEGGGMIRATIMLSWKHNRSSADEGLKLCHWISNERLMVAFYSRSNSLLTFQSFQLPADEYANPIATSAPTMICFPSESNFETSRVLTVGIQAIDFEKAKPKLSGTEPSSLQYSDGIRYFMLTALFDDYSVVEQIIYVCEPGTHVAVPEPTWIRKGPISESRITKSNLDGREDTRIGIRNKRAYGTFNKNEHMMESVRIDAEDIKKRDLSVPKRKRLDLEIAFNRKPATPERLSCLESVIEGAIYGNSYSAYAHLHNWLEVTSGHFTVGDVDETDRAIRDALTHVFEAEDAVDRPIGTVQSTPPALKYLKSVKGNLRFSTAYEDIISQWLSKLPEDVPSKIRVAKERLARKVAAEICLATMALVADVKAPTHGEKQKPAEITKDHFWPLQPSSPLQSHGDEQDTKASSSQQTENPLSSSADAITRRASRTNSPLLPTPSATPSILSSSSTYLGRNTTYPTLNSRGHHPPVRSLPKALSRCLSSWPLGENPYAFNGDESINAVMRPADADDEDDQSGLSAAERRRLQRRAERLLKRQRRQAAKVAVSSSAAAPDGVVALQLRPAVAAGSSSSYARSSQAAGKMPELGGNGNVLVGASSQQAPVSSQLPTSSQMERRRSGVGVQAGDRSARKRRRVAGF